MNDAISPLDAATDLASPAGASPGKSPSDSPGPASLPELQNMAVMGELAEAVAHDFNNILSATLIHLGLLLQDKELNAGQKDSLRTLEQETTRAAVLTRQLLSFSRRRFISRNETIDLNQVVQGIEKLLKHLVRENVILSFQPCVEECLISADIGQVEKLVMSLCLALREAMPKGGKFSLRTTGPGIEIGTEPGPARRGEKVVCLAIAGSRREEAASPHDISSRAATGAILSGWKFETARQIVQQHNGWIVAHLDTATPEIRVYLPAASEGDVAEEESGRPEAIKGGTETILLVEDEDILRRISAISLRKLGYAVLDTVDGDGALKLWEKHHAKIDLLLTDFQLPGSQNGYELIQRFTSQKPSLRGMLSTGNHADLDECTRPGGTPFFPAMKPYKASRLAQMVRECLDRPI